MADDYHEQLKLSEMMNEKEEEEMEMMKIVFVCGAVLGVTIFILIVLRILIFVKNVQNKILKKKEEKNIEAIKIQIERIVYFLYKIIHQKSNFYLKKFENTN